MKKPWKAQLLTALLCNLFLAGTVMVFSPLEVFVGSFQDFHFQFGVTWQVMTLAALTVTAALTALEMLLPRRAALACNVLTFALGICCYMQMMFLNGKMVSLTGANMQTTRTERIVNLGIWAAMLAAAMAGAFWLSRKKKEEILHTVLRYVSALLTVMQAVALVVFALTTDMSGSGEFIVTGEGRFELAPKNNTVVFVIDSAENTIFDKVLEEFPDTYDALSGFTYYPDALSMHSRTYPSLTYMLTGEVCHYDKTPAEYTQEAFRNGRMLRDLKAAGIDSRAYTWDFDKLSVEAEAYLGNVFNTHVNSFENVLPLKLIGGMLSVSLYKVAPYRLKYELEYNVDRINQGVVQYDTEQYQYYDYEYYHDLQASDLTVNEQTAGAFRFYHLFGSHHDLYWDENMNRIEETDDKVRPLRGSLRIIEAYVRKLDEAGLLDKTTIIVTADHGKWGDASSTEINRAFRHPPTPLMLVKYPDSDMSRPLAVSHAPVAHEDLFATVIDGCGLDASAYGRTIREIAEYEKRERRYYHTAYSIDDGGELVLKEYRIDGDANTFDSWTYTGNYWEILHSPYFVSRHKYEGE